MYAARQMGIVEMPEHAPEKNVSASGTPQEVFVALTC
jgi:hypothetical protein